MFGLMFAAALANSTPVDTGRSWLTARDYPADARKRGEEGILWFVILVSPEGRVVRCDIVQSQLSSELNEKTCSLVTARAKFRPATDETGAPIYSEWQTRMEWFLPSQRQPSTTQSITMPVDMEIQVQKLPKGAREKSVGLVVKIDTDGHVTHCQGIKPDKNDAKLVNVACTQARALTMESGKDNDGRPIPFVRAMLVAFRTPVQ
ncbi:hypothetical protein CG471_21810 [Sphingobium sp. IP1]|uniref:TonB family protein n=1 Tax=Sphingobium sp. IP1 TaxID=2021637 RepID=UPI000C0814B1|nr:TonB family protein [Sphingobium sp. IP1]PHP17614.1 hypothetical protein CG471_21810 [Sphingobium sp. IP1]